jgi:hypothetical protein
VRVFQVGMAAASSHSSPRPIRSKPRAVAAMAAAPVLPERRRPFRGVAAVPHREIAASMIDTLQRLEASTVAVALIADTGSDRAQAAPRARR